MKRVIRSSLAVAGVLLLAACTSGPPAGPATPSPLVVEELEGAELSRLTLSAKAAERLGIETVAVEEAPGGRGVLPYSAVLYDPDGTTWVYTNPDGLTFIRSEIAVDRIEGDLAVLSSGPPAGTLVVTVGGPELYGAEHGVGGGH